MIIMFAKLIEKMKIVSWIIFLVSISVNSWAGSHITVTNNCSFCRKSSTDTKITQTTRLQTFDYSSLNLKNSLQNTVLQTTSAISISLNDFNAIAAVGNTWLNYFTANTMGMNIGTANSESPQTWSLPPSLMNNFNGTGRSDFIAPSSVPAALQRAGSNRVMKTLGLDNTDRLMNIYEHFDINSAGIIRLGTSYDLEVGADDNFDELDYEYTDVPLDLGDVFQSIVDEEDYETNLALIKYESDITVDAYGTLSTPDGTFNCLRMSIQTQKFTRPNESSAYTLSTTTNQVSFLTKEGIYFNANVSATNGNVTLSNVSYRKVVQPAQLTDLNDVKINNNNKGVTINNDNDDPHPSAILDIKSSTLGVLIPRIAMANRPSIPTEGLLIYQIDNIPGFYFYDGSAWQRLNSTTVLMASNNEKNVSARINQSENILPTSPSFTGKERLLNGATFIKFERPIENYEGLQINIQLEGDCMGVFVSNKTREGFEVKELQKGKSNAIFRWKIIKE
jgi:hypothetical protein